METAPTGQKKSKPSSDWLRYSGLGIQLLVTIGLFGWAGHWLDVYLNLKFPAFLLLLVMLSFAGNIFLLIRSNNQN